MDVHLIQPSRKRVVSNRQLRTQIRTLNRAYAGQQSADGARARVRFVRASTDVTVNKTWFRSYSGSKAEKTIIRTLRRGGSRHLNIYLKRPRTEAGELDGYTKPLWEHAGLNQDSVVMSVRAVSGGTSKHWDRGDLAVTLSGSWLGLYVVFQGGCSLRSDQVADTPRMITDTFDCSENSDTCPAPGNDPVHNFMNYSDDSCRTHFTPGQVERLHKMWRAFRR